jgi:hypothetical protein
MILVKSSNSFLAPMLVAYLTNNIFYSIACFNLYLSSQIYHRTGTKIPYIWDQLSIQIVYWTGFYYNLTFPLLYSSQYWIETLYLLFIYYYGFLKKRYCFGPNGYMWHATIHYTASVSIILTLLCEHYRGACLAATPCPSPPLLTLI